MRPMADDLEERRRLHDSDDEEDVERDTHRLPWGIRKKVVEAAPPESSARPRIGDEVSVTYVAKLQDGTEVGAHREEKKPFRFVIGRQPRQIVEGFELGVQTMRRGEIAELTLASRYAYGDLGSKPHIPPDATMVFEIKLLDFECKVDLFQDGKAVKTLVERGSGESRPSTGQEVLVSLRVLARGGKVLDEYEEVEHVVGSPDFGVSSKIVTQALLHMVEGEKASVFCRRFAGCTLVDKTLQGATLELHLVRVYEKLDVSPTQDGSLMKKVLCKGTGQAAPPEASRVKLLVEAISDGAAPVVGFVGPRTLEFRLGDGEVCDALEFAATAMRLGERADLTCSKPALCAEPRLGLGEVQAQRLVLTVELLGIADGADVAAMSLEERHSFAAARKAVAADLFKRQRHRLALGRYNRILALFSQSDDDDATQQLRVTCQLNRAACLLKLDDNAAARAACDKVLAYDPDQIKALYRRGSACFALSDYGSAQKDLAKVLRLDPKNAEARSLLVQVREAQKRYAEDAKSTAARMWGAKPATAPSAALDESPLAGKAMSHMQIFKPLAACLPCLPLPCFR